MSSVPQHTLEAINRYVDHHIEPGSFLEAVLCNDLKEACSRADFMNSLHLYDIVKYLYNNVPSNCWGSREAYEAWLNRSLKKLNI